jgi:hypothetical protein
MTGLRRARWNAGPSMGFGILFAAAVALAALQAVPSAAAYDESEAPSLRPDVLRVWHEPEAPQPHTQWRGFLQMRPSSNVTEAHYQVCRVGQACFAPPTPAGRLDDGTFAFDTSGYLANGRPVDYQAGWRLGVKWFLTEPNATAEFPKGPDLASPECAGDAAMRCSESHYFVFTMGGEAGRPAPGPGLAALALVPAAALLRRRV